MDFVETLLARNGYLPHGYCFTWTPGLLWTMVIADALIAISYLSIPLAIASFVRRRGESGPTTKVVAWLFCSFIVACASTHLMDVWTIWRPDYGLQALSKVLTGAISLITGVALWIFIPQALKIPTVRQLEAVIASLEAEVGLRRTAENSLSEIEQSLAITLSSIGAGFIATDRGGAVTRMNAVASRVTGWTEAEALGNSYWSVFVRDRRPNRYFTQSVVDVMIDEKVTMETARAWIAIGRDGTRTSLEVKAAVTYAADGSARGIALVFRDMTALRKAEADATRLAAIVESSHDAIVGKTLDGRITSWNAAAELMFGYSRDEAIGQNIEMLIPPDRRNEEMRILTDLARGVDVPSFETQRRSRDGTRLHVSIALSPIRDASGRIVGASKIARDISGQRRAELALRASDERLRFTLESAHIGDWDLDLKTRVASRSLRHDRCFGYEEAQPVWGYEIFMRHVHPDDRDGVDRSFEAAVRERTSWATECRVIWPDGSTHWISCDGHFFFESGTPTRMLGIIFDITRQRLAEAVREKALRLEAENQQILEANRLKSQFLANMSHELRTPLNAIIGFSELMLTGIVEPSSSKHDEFVGYIHQSGRHLLQLINDILDLSKVESGKFEFFPTDVHLPRLITDVIGILRGLADAKGLSVDAETDPSIETVFIDAGRLKQVLYNYLSNAIKFTPQGGHIKVRASYEGSRHFRLEVEDTGIGIAAADLSRLFSEFQQLDAGYSKQHQGTGLGLALTRRLVEAQNGTVGVRSAVGEGSVFHAILPLGIRDGLQVDEPRAVGGTRVLLIESNEANVASMSSVLAKAGVGVDAVRTGAAAIEHARRQPYAALTLDLILPDRSGLGVLANIRGTDLNRAAPVVAVTIPLEGGAGASFAITDVLAKPIRTDEVVAAMAQWRGRRPVRARVVVIDDESVALDLMKSTLDAIGIDCLAFTDGKVALLEIERHAPDAVILDLMMPDFDGFAVLNALRSTTTGRRIPVYIWTSMTLTDVEYAALSSSARAILGKGGGALDATLDSLRLWRPPVTAVHSSEPS